MKSLTAKDIMKSKVITVTDNLSIHQLAAFLCEYNISGAPVLDEQGKLIGVVSHTDIINWHSQSGAFEQSEYNDYHQSTWNHSLSEDNLEQLRIIDEGTTLVKDIMTPVVFSITEDTPVTQIASEMLAGQIHRMVVTKDKDVVGIVTTLDMLKVIKEQ